MSLEHQDTSLKEFRISYQASEKLVELLANNETGLPPEDLIRIRLVTAAYTLLDVDSLSCSDDTTSLSPMDFIPSINLSGATVEPAFIEEERRRKLALLYFQPNSPEIYRVASVAGYIERLGGTFHRDSRLCLPLPLVVGERAIRAAAEAIERELQRAWHQSRYAAGHPGGTRRYMAEKPDLSVKLWFDE